MFRQRINCYLIERMKRENELQAVDKSRWYAVNRKCLPPDLLETFQGHSYDEGTEHFIAECYRKSNNMFTSFLIAIARSFLKLFMSATSVCGFLGCGSMFVFSEAQFRDFVVDGLLEHRKKHPRPDRLEAINSNTYSTFDDNNGYHQLPPPESPFLSSSSITTTNSTAISNNTNIPDKLIAIDPNGPPFGAMLDLGAGDGNITSIMSPYFSVTYATEVSRFMQSRLQKRGFRLLDAFKWAEKSDNLASSSKVDGDKISEKFDLISLLNVLDRCDRPLQMLADIHRKLRQSDGLLLLALVFPLCQYVEYTADHQAAEKLTVEGATFEHQVVSFCRDVLQPAGFEVIRWSKLPYLCEGNVDLTYFWLIDAVFLLRAVEKNKVESKETGIEDV